MVKKKVTKSKVKKKTTKNKDHILKKAKLSKTKKKSEKLLSPLESIYKENENQLISLITKDFDKDLALKSKTYVKSYSKIEDSIITVKDFLNYIENHDEDLFKLFKAYSSSVESDSSSSNDETEEEEKSTGVKSDDPVRMYLK